MFERFTPEARTVVVEAQDRARELHAEQITADHLLLAVLDQDGTPAARVFGELGLRRAALLDDITGLGDADADALRAVGVDLQSVRRHAEETFGPGALDGPSFRRAAWWRPRWSGATTHLPFSAAAKQVLARSLEQAIELGDRHITTDHVALGLLADDHDAAARTVARLGLSPAAVREQVRARCSDAA